LPNCIEALGIEVCEGFFIRVDDKFCQLQIGSPLLHCDENRQIFLFVDGTKGYVVVVL
jgi:hypothetical protein